MVNRSRASGTGGLVLKVERRPKNSSGSGHGGSCDNLTAADFLHDKFLPQMKLPVRAVLRSIVSIVQHTIFATPADLANNPISVPTKPPAFYILRIVSYRW